MEFNLLLAGVGGQGILTIAHAISRVAMSHGYHVKQSEVHGMSQRGGAVLAHLRFADHAISSDLIPSGRADMLLTVEPMEALRYAEFLADNGIVVASSVPFINIPDYPPVENTLERIAQLGDHVLIDADRLAKVAGSARSQNMVMLGAATLFLEFLPEEFEKLVAKAFASKGERVVEINRRALRIGRRAAALFREGLQQGQTSRGMHRWMASLAPDRLSDWVTDDEGKFASDTATIRFPKEADERIQAILESVRQSGRSQLFEHEVYSIVESAGAISPPRHRFVAMGENIAEDVIAEFSGERVVLKIVSPDIVHKTESGGLAFVPKTLNAVRHGVDTLIEGNDPAANRIQGVLIVEFVEQAQRGLGSELFVGVRQTREFGPVIAAGLGGIDTEYLALKMQPGLAVAKASAIDTSPEEFFALFQKTAAYEILAGRVRGHERIVGDGNLLRCFRAFTAIARRYGQHGVNGFRIEEIEVNPFAFRRQQMVPLDGRGRLAPVTTVPRARPLESVNRMLEPSSIAIAGVSSKRENFGRTILNNIQKCGFSPEHLYIIKEGEDAIDGIPCVPGVARLPEKIDLLVVATSADKISALVNEVLPEDGCTSQCSSVILIPGALGEKEGTQDVHAELRCHIEAARARNPHAPVFLGGNCMGVRSRPGGYDTFFIPAEKLDLQSLGPPGRCAIISQSGAFLITRMSNLEFLEPAFAISVGNQVDLTVSDMVQAMTVRDDIDCIGVYIEGFNERDGLTLLRTVEHATKAGKTVVFYKAGRTSAGASATMGHTASVAGDYDVCQAAVAAAGAIVTDTFKEFEQLLELATDLHDKSVRGKRIGGISNAGYEAVGMADTIKGARYQLQIAGLSNATKDGLTRALERHGIHRLADVRNPLDLTPMADDQAYEDCVQVMLEAEEIDAVVVGCVPMTPRLLTTPREIEQPGSIAERIPRLLAKSTKPLIFVVDGAGQYDALARRVRSAGVPVLRSADQAIRSLGRYLSHRCEHGPVRRNRRFQSASVKFEQNETSDQSTVAS